MIRNPSLLSPEVRPLLDQERAIPAQPAIVRARALARARAAVAAGIAVAADPPPVPVRPPLAVSVTLACVVSAAVGLVAYQIHAHFARARVPAQAPAEPMPAPAGALPAAPAAPATVQPIEEAPPPSMMIPRPRPSPFAAVRAELRLLRQARAAVAREDFAAALPPIAEHARRFRDGRLAEEREALRVGALAGLGRDQDARRAAIAFRARFPRSVLVPAVDQLSAAAR
jgi:hypothetical protein